MLKKIVVVVKDSASCDIGGKYPNNADFYKEIELTAVGEMGLLASNNEAGILFVVDGGHPMAVFKNWEYWLKKE